MAISTDENWSIRRLLQWATDDFQRRGFESPRLESELLLGLALGKSRIELITQSEHVPSDTELAQFRELLRRRRLHEPTAYLIGQREFYGLDMQVDRRVLIPRPDTETLVEVALQRSQHLYAHGHALDLCTGSGCVALAFAHRRSGWSVTGSDISQEALQVAERNALRLGKILGMTWVQSDLFESLPQQKFDLITANPPYIPSAEVLQLHPTIREFEPQMALDGGEDGLKFTRPIVERAPAWLQPGGALAVEIGCDQGPVVEALFREVGFCDTLIHKDYGARHRVVSGQWSA
jgi:release factor glutamine methyltransferase